MIESKLPVNCCNYLKYTITPIRLIPADLGYTITNQHVSVIKDLLTQNGVLFSENIPIFGENALFKISLCHNLEAYIYYDGIIIFVFIDECLPYHYFKIDDVGFILDNRKNAHKLLLTHNHSISKKIDELCFTLRNLVDESLRRLTSYPSWENGSLSYVMSFYHINADSKIYHDELFVSCLSQLLYPDHHTYYGGVRANVTDNYKEKVLVNHDVLDNVHVSISWANVIIVGELTNSQLSYYTTLELSLQHIWMYSYVTEKMIDALLESSDHHISAKKLDEFYNVINDMTLIVKKYDGVISSTLHEREYKLFGALKESSRIESIIKNIEYKSNLLERKLRWELSRKSLRSDRNTELLLIFLTAFQCFFIISENLKTLINPILLLLFLLLLFVILIIYRKKY